MDKTWIMVANAARARCFERRETDGKLQELADFVHPQSRQKGVDLAADRGGHLEKGPQQGGGGGTQYEPRTDPRQKEHAAFASELALAMDEALAGGRCQAWALLASNPFLGELKSHLSPRAAKALRAAIPSDLTSFEGAELKQHVDRALAPA